MADQQQRQTAYKVQVKSILKGDFIKQEGWKPNYIIDEYGRKISRINLIATIVDVPESQDTFNYYGIILDDGTGTISARVFEDQERLKKFSLGQMINIIGRIREYGNERYIIPEIIKKIDDSGWIDLHNKEITLLKKTLIEKPKEDLPEIVVEEDIVKKPDTIHIDTSEKILSAIRNLDKGDGADIDEVIEKCSIDGCEGLVNSLLLEGDIFEIKPGRLKVLD